MTYWSQKNSHNDLLFFLFLTLQYEAPKDWRVRWRKGEYDSESAILAILLFTGSGLTQGMVIIITFEKLVLPYFTFLSGKTNDYLGLKNKGITTSINNYFPFGTKSGVLDAKHIISLTTIYLVFYQKFFAQSVLKYIYILV